MTYEPQNPHALARWAGCYAPDNTNSDGAQFLSLVQDSTIEAWEFAVENDCTELEDQLFEIADGCVPIYTTDVWDTFIDLGAYEQDITDYTSGDESMEEQAKLALYVIASNVAEAIWNELQTEVALV